jgi:hypothetical protein
MKYYTIFWGCLTEIEKPNENPSYYRPIKRYEKDIEKWFSSVGNISTHEPYCELPDDITALLWFKLQYGG